MYPLAILSISGTLGLRKSPQLNHNNLGADSIRGRPLHSVMTNKKCIRCGEVKSVREFWKSYHNSDGLQAYCMQCVKEYRKNHPGTIPKKKIKKYDEDSRYNGWYVNKNIEFADKINLIRNNSQASDDDFDDLKSLFDSTFR